MNIHPFVWLGFFGLILALLALDIGVFQKRAHKISVKEALMWTAFWIALAMIFNVFVYFWLGSGPALDFFTGFLLEKSLSVDNLFVFLIILTYFCVPKIYWHKVLFYGILGALIMRGLFIGGGIALISMFHPILYIFGALLIISAFRMGFGEEKEIKPERNPVLRLFRKFMPVTKEYVGSRFFTKKGFRSYATPMLVVLIVIETTDIVFAMDSVPAIFAITLEPFIVYTSNIFAILGLRALFFALAGIMTRAYYLSYGLSFILGFIGVKILISYWYEIPTAISLGVVGCVLLVTIVASYLHAKREKKRARKRKKAGKSVQCKQKSSHIRH